MSLALNPHKKKSLALNLASYVFLGITEVN
jgi:hypothetical protein